jgi:hypothetical protein
MSDTRFHGNSLLLSALVGATLVLVSTRTGLFNTIDSAAYVEAARHLGDTGSLGGSLAHPTQFPPLYSAVLSLAVPLGIDVLLFARFLNALLFAGTIMLSGCLIVRVKPDGRLLPLLGGVWIATSVDLLLMHTAVLSEGLFIFLVSCWFLFLCRYLESPRLSSLLLAASAAALAPLCRFIGIALPLAAVPLLLAGSQRSIRRRYLDALAHSLVAGLPLVAWLLEHQLLSEHPTLRPLGVHPPNWAHLHGVVDAISRWWLPNAVPFPLRASALGLGLGVLVWLAIRARAGSARSRGSASRQSNLARLAGAYLAAYGIVLLASATFVDADLGIGPGAVARLLAPAYVPSFLIVVAVVARSLERAPLTAWGRRAALAALGLGVGLHALQAAYNVSQWYQDGLGFANSRWRESVVIERVRRLPPDTITYTNAPSALYLLAERTTRSLPRKYDPFSLGISPEYSAELEAMTNALRREKGVVVFLRDMAFDYYPSEDELRATLALRPEERDEIGTIYGVD